MDNENRNPFQQHLDNENELNKKEKYSYYISESESYIIVFKHNTDEERIMAITDSAEKADFFCKAANFYNIKP